MLGILDGVLFSLLMCVKETPDVCSALASGLQQILHPSVRPDRETESSLTWEMEHIVLCSRTSEPNIGSSNSPPHSTATQNGEILKIKNSLAFQMLF